MDSQSTAEQSRARRDNGLLFPERRAGLLEPERPPVDHDVGLQNPDAAADYVSGNGQRPAPRGYADMNATAGP